MSLQQQPSAEEFRQAFLKAPRYFWPTFEHMHLNCFDLASALLTFPGDISKARASNSGLYSDFKFDISNLETCRRRDEDYDVEIWNEKSLAVRWYLGFFDWACSVDVGDCSLTYGSLNVSLSVTQFQNIPELMDVEDANQLKLAMRKSLEGSIKDGAFPDYEDTAVFLKVINDRNWTCLKVLKSPHCLTYLLVLPVGGKTVLWITANLDNCWTQGEVVPAEVERKHLESLWDFLSQINLTHTRDESFEAGTVVREAPGQAEPAPDDYSW